MKTVNVDIQTVSLPLPGNLVAGDFQVTLVCTDPETTFTQQVKQGLTPGAVFEGIPPGSYSVTACRLDSNGAVMGDVHTAAFVVPAQAMYDAPSGVTVSLS